MLRALRERLRQGHRTMAWPDGPPPPLPERFRGLPSLDPAACAEGCPDCLESCPTDALSREGARLRLDLGRCLFCGDCEAACPTGAIHFTGHYQLAATSRDGLLVDGDVQPRVERLHATLRRLFGRSLRLRQVSAGGCNACEADVNVLGTIGWDLGRFGIQLVASPRHADGLLITGPVTQNMRLALEKTWEAVPAPKLAIAVGACAISGGPFFDHPETCGGADDLLPIDLYIPGCPPHPLTILDGLLRLLGRLDAP
jgi:Ni,Fe-hydrogenase III small subunit/NAD-dependent dihydropyrimidine dehydrogenase PreA subunit